LKGKNHTTLAMVHYCKNEKKKKKFPHLLPTPTSPKEKNQPCKIHVQPFHWLHSIAKTICHYFWLKLSALAKSWGTYFILISWGCFTSPIFIFIFWKEPIWLAQRKKKVQTMHAPQNRRFYGKMECLPFDPPM
jgi:hypothetical protein